MSFLKLLRNSREVLLRFTWIMGSGGRNYAARGLQSQKPHVRAMFSRNYGSLMLRRILAIGIDTVVYRDLIIQGMRREYKSHTMGHKAQM